MIVNQIARKAPKVKLGEEVSVVELERKKITDEARFISVIGFEYDILYLMDARKNQRLIEVQLL